MKRMMEQARYNGFITNRWERKLYVEPERSYVATDYLVQSSGRDTMADAMFRVSEMLKKYGGHLALPIHDELISWVPTEPTPEMVAEYSAAMTSHKFSQPLTASPKWGKTLAALH